MVDEAPAAAQVAAADVEHAVLGAQPVLDQVVELHLPERQPAVVGPAADRGLRVAPGVGGHHRPVVADVVGVLDPQPRVPAGPADVGGDALGVAQRVPDLVGERGAVAAQFLRGLGVLGHGDLRTDGSEGGFVGQWGRRTGADRAGGVRPGGAAEGR